MRSILNAILAAALLTGCSTQTSTPTQALLPTALPDLPTATLTATPAPSATPSPTLAPSPSATAARTATPAASATPAPARPQGLPAVLATPDCKAQPGFPGCPAGLAIGGRLALYDAGKGLLRVLDFGARSEAQITAKGLKGLDWLAQGDFLSATGADGKDLLAWANPASSKLPDLPGQSAQGRSIFKSADGSSAWLEQKDTLFIFHIRSAAGAEQTWPAESKPSDRVHEILGWVPGSSLLLAGWHFASNSMWVTGNRLYTVDTRSGAIKDLPANLRLGGAFAWHPQKSGLLALADLSQADMGAARLAVLDVTSGQVTRPLADAAVSSSDPVWTPDGSALLHAALKPGAPAGDAFALAGIYRTEWPGGGTRRLTSPPANLRDQWPQVSADGKSLLYMRANPENKQAELRLAGLDGKSDALLLAGLDVSTALQPPEYRWRSVAAYAP